ncbi:hypothetical protein AYI70_g6297, partial [Smittium culicis]
MSVSILVLEGADIGGKRYGVSC